MIESSPLDPTRRSYESTGREQTVAQEVVCHGETPADASRESANADSPKQVGSREIPARARSPR